MNKSVMSFVEHCNAKSIIFDIDGTLKDLCKEHTNAVRTTLEHFRVSRFRKKVVLALNKLAMYVVKTGFISTNHSKQNLLLKVYAIISNVKMIEFYDEYFENYTRELCLFDGVYELLDFLNKEKAVYFATINKQNYNLEECGIPQGRITYTEGAFKVATYNSLLKSIGVDKSQVIIIGDNFFDDFVSAKHLGVKCLVVNRYNSKLKSVICKLTNSRHLK